MSRRITSPYPWSRLSRIGAAARAAVGASVARALPQDRTILLVLAIALVLLAALSLLWGQSIEHRHPPGGVPGEPELTFGDASDVFASRDDAGRGQVA